MSDLPSPLQLQATVSNHNGQHCCQNSSSAQVSTVLSLQHHAPADCQYALNLTDRLIVVLIAMPPSQNMHRSQNSKVQAVCWSTFSATCDMLCLSSGDVDDEQLDVELEAADIICTTPEKFGEVQAYTPQSIQQLSCHAEQE